MTRLAERLNDLAIRQSKPDEHKAKVLPDGNGLRLVIHPNGVKAWQFRTKRTGKETTLQIGTYPGVTLAMARKEAAALRETLRQGRDPITERRAARARKRVAAATTFEAVAESLLSAPCKRFAKQSTDLHPFEARSIFPRDAMSLSASPAAPVVPRSTRSPYSASNSLFSGLLFSRA